MAIPDTEYGWLGHPEKGLVLPGENMNFKCPKCKQRKAKRYIPFGMVPELKRIGVFMKRGRYLCNKCAEEATGK